MVETLPVHVYIYIYIYMWLTIDVLITATRRSKVTNSGEPPLPKQRIVTDEGESSSEEGK